MLSLKTVSKSLVVAAACLLVSAPLSAGKPKPKPADAKAPNNQVVDEGTFSISVAGTRVASEAFSIKQNGPNSVSKSQLRMADGKTGQDCELSMAANGNLLKYDWKELEPPKGENIVEPSNDFLVEHYSTPEGKIGDQPFLMPSSSVILEDFFFSHRQLLLWRYLASSCTEKETGRECQFAKTQYGVVIPRQRISSMVSVEYKGVEKMQVKGAEKQLSKFKITTEGPDWFVYLDENFKVQKIAIPETNTEAVRD